MAGELIEVFALYDAAERAVAVIDSRLDPSIADGSGAALGLDGSIAPMNAPTMMMIRQAQRIAMA